VSAPALPRPTASAWLLATRPRTLVCAAVPVAVGTALAAAEGRARALPAAAALLGALLIQVATNLVNDYYDFIRGADTAERVGPTRVTQAGLISPRTVISAAGAVAGLAVLVGLYLASVGGWPVVAIGVASLLAGFAYTGGPFPLGYHGLGDVFVFAFFGLVAVGGTYYVEAGALSSAALLCALPVGALSTAILVVNNLRDAATDAKSGKRTLAVRLGERFARAEWLALVILAFATPVVLVALGLVRPGALVSLVALPLARAPWRLVRDARGAPLNQGLGLTARLLAIHGMLFALGIWL
jgi:1,4-dihydroxy-2-naphthoate octaprenyltransferase